MKLKKIIATTMLSAVVLGAVGPAASAAFPETKDTKGLVNFKEPNDKDPKPTDPTKPEVDPLDPDTEHPGTSGLLRFDWLPVFDFGSIELDGKAASQNVKHDTYKLKTPASTFYAAPAVEITDARGNNAGWQAEVSASDFVLMKADNSGPETGASAGTLAGAKITMKAATINTHGGIVGKKPTSTITAATPLVIGGGVASKGFADAEVDKGMSQWSIGFSKDIDAKGYINKYTTQGTDESVNLSVPVEAKKLQDRKYESTLTWTLKDTPL